MTNEEFAILGKSINIKKLYETNPELFDITKLDIRDKIKLMQIDKKYVSTLNIDKMSIKDRVAILGNTANDIRKHITFSDAELLKIPKTDYDNTVLLLNFKKYAIKSRIEKLSNANSLHFFIRNTSWYIDNGVKFPRPSAYDLTNLARSKPALVNQYFTDFTNLSTTFGFWVNMFNYDPKYKSIFINNTKSCLTKSEVRAVIYDCPGIVKLLTPTLMNDSKLTCKEWVLLIHDVTMHGHCDAELKDFNFSDEMKESIKQDLTAEILTGKSTSSKTLNKVLNNMI